MNAQFDGATVLITGGTGSFGNALLDTLRPTGIREIRIYSRDELKDMIEQNGGKNVGSISAKTNYVLAGENMGPAKLEKATKLGIKIISETDFLEMIN